MECSWHYAVHVKQEKAGSWFKYCSPPNQNQNIKARSSESKTKYKNGQAPTSAANKLHPLYPLRLREREREDNHAYLKTFLVGAFWCPVSRPSTVETETSKSSACKFRHIYSANLNIQLTSCMLYILWNEHFRCQVINKHIQWEI